jgi:large subunit ribosomal protein L21
MLSSRIASGALQRLLQACAAACQPSLSAASAPSEPSTSYNTHGDASLRHFSSRWGPHTTNKKKEARLRNRASWLAAEPFLPERPERRQVQQEVITSIPPLPARQEPALFHKVGRIAGQYALAPQDAFAVCEIGGSQFKVTADDVIYFPRLAGVDIDDVLSLNRVLLAGSKDATVVGRPLLPGARVVAAVEEIFKDYKIFNFKLKRRKGYKRFKGHRDQLVALRILEVSVPGLAELPAEQRVWAAAACVGDGQQQESQQQQQQQQQEEGQQQRQQEGRQQQQQQQQQQQRQQEGR